MNFIKAGNSLGQYISCSNEFSLIEKDDTVLVDRYFGDVEEVVYSSSTYLIVKCSTFTLHLELDVTKDFGLFVLATANADSNEILTKFYVDEIRITGNSGNTNLRYGIKHIF